MQVLQPTLFGCVGYGEGLKAKPGKLAPPELWLVEPALDSAGWKPALLDGGTDAFLPVLGEQEECQTPRRALPAFVGRRPTPQPRRKAIFLALQERKCSNRPFRLCLYRPRV